MSHVYGSNKYVLSFGEQAPGERLPLTGTTISTHTISKAGWGLTENLYAGTVAYVVRGTGGGETILNVISNTGTAITVREELNEGANIDQDSVLMFDMRFSSVENYYTEWGGSYNYPRNAFLAVCEDFDFPTPTIDYEEIWTHDTGQDRKYFVHKKTTFDTSAPLIVFDFRFPFMLFGAEIGDGTTVTGGGSTTSSETVYARDDRVAVVSTTNFTAGDYVRIGSYASGTSEVRKIRSISSNTLILDFPFRMNHASGSSVVEVTSPYTHKITPANNAPYIQIAGAYTETPDFVRDGLRFKITAGEFSSETGDMLKFSADLVGGDVLINGSQPSVTVPSASPYQYRMVSGGISLNGTTYANVESFRYRLERGIQTIYTHQNVSADKPFYLIEAKRRHEIGMVIVPTDDSIYDLLDGSTSFQIELTFNRGTNDTLLMHFENVYLSAAPHGFVIDGPVRVTGTFHAGSGTYFVITDTIPYYPVGGL